MVWNFQEPAVLWTNPDPDIEPDDETKEVVIAMITASLKNSIRWTYLE